MSLFPTSYFVTFLTPLSSSPLVPAYSIFAIVSHGLWPYSSIQRSETYQVWGSNTAGSPGTLLATNQSGTTFDLSSDSQYPYITISSPNGSVLIDSLVATVPSSSTSTPEPSSATLLLFGLAGLAGIGVLAKK